MRPAFFAAVLAFAGCSPAPAPAPPPALVLPVASAVPPPPASSSGPPPAPPCTPRTWPKVDVSAGSFAFGRSEPDAAALAAASPGLRATCQRMELAAKQHETAVLPWGPPPFGTERKQAVWKSTTMGCYAGKKGAWIIDVGVFHREGNGVGDVGPWQLVYLTPDGQRIASKDARGDDWEADGEGRIYSTIGGVADVDGDGVDEVSVVTAGYASIDGEHDSGPVLYHLQDGVVVPWDPVPGERVVGSLDADRDGKMDLVLKGGPRFELAHALGGGRFSTDDDVTRAFLHALCQLPLPAPPVHVGTPMPLPTVPGQAAHAEDVAAKQCAALLALDCPHP